MGGGTGRTEKPKLNDIMGKWYPYIKYGKRQERGYHCKKTFEEMMMRLK